MHGIWGAMLLFKFAMLDVTGLLIHNWELELPYCIIVGCHNIDNSTSSALVFILESLLKQVSLNHS